MSYANGAVVDKSVSEKMGKTDVKPLPSLSEESKVPERLAQAEPVAMKAKFWRKQAWAKTIDGVPLRGD